MPKVYHCARDSGRESRPDGHAGMVPTGHEGLTDGSGDPWLDSRGMIESTDGRGLIGVSPDDMPGAATRVTREGEE